MAGFTKLFASITESSIWTADDKTLRVWIAMLARSDSVGVVEGSVPGFASLCRMDVKSFAAAVEKLTSPDPYSRTPDNEGRRIQAIPGGWLILNYLAYRNRCQSQPGSRAADMRRYRERKRSQGPPTVTGDGNALPVNVTGDTEAEAEAENTKTGTDPAREGGRVPVVQAGSMVEVNPTLEEVKAFADRNAILPECAEKWFLDHDARGWLDRTGQPIARWGSSLRSYAIQWRANANRDAANGKAGHGKPPAAAMKPDWSDPKTSRF